MKSTHTFNEMLLDAIQAIIKARREDRMRRAKNPEIDNLPTTRKSEHAPTVSSQAKYLHDFVTGRGMGNPHVQAPTLEEIARFLNEAIKELERDIGDVEDMKVVLARVASKDLVLSKTYELVCILDY